MVVWDRKVWLRGFRREVSQRFGVSGLGLEDAMGVWDLELAALEWNFGRECARTQPFGRRCGRGCCLLHGG